MKKLSEIKKKYPYMYNLAKMIHDINRSRQKFINKVKEINNEH
ncbi:MAG: hypothetical protein Tp1124SUR00d2C54018391_9 [Prokaryotic dsDNA virus sp.]|nr:MAG: hypothetical protein Tp1124SUR00d2C54018391_9 [Prokaryotic dsDNA virus sp.]